MNPRPPRHAPLAYRTLTLAAALPAFLHAVLRSLRDGGRDYLLQRYARALPRGLEDRICLHCCSVGEVRAVLPLARELQNSGHQLLLSVSTPTGHRLARGLLAELPCVYFPLDHVWTTRRWLKRMRPKAILIVETELWPNFFAAAQRREIPMALVNARLSRRTSSPPALLRLALRQAASRLQCILARSEQDAERFAALGAPPERIECLGNIKYAAATEEIPNTPPVPPPYVLAVSTHKDEEEQIARVWRTLDTGEQRLVFLPRYPDQAPEILKQLQALGLQVGLHSRDRQPRPGDELYLADTLGEALWWMRHATFVFVGGSLVPRGGHNVMEPAMLGKACAVGPHTEHFETETRDLLDCGGLVQAQNADELGQVFARWLREPEKAERIGAQGRAHVRDRNQLIHLYAAALRRYGVLD